MANSEVLEGGLLCGLRNDLGGQEVAAWQNWQFDKYGDRKIRRGLPEANCFSRCRRLRVFSSE